MDTVGQLILFIATIALVIRLAYEENLQMRAYAAAKEEARIDAEVHKIRSLSNR